MDSSVSPSSPRLLVLVGSPRRDGNSALLAQAVERGAQQAGTPVAVHFLDDFISGFLRDERAGDAVAQPDDRYGELFLDLFLPAQGIVFCTPVYWYGMSAQTKAFFDRSFTYYAASHPRSRKVLAGMADKRLGLTLASEESYPGAGMGITHQIQEFARYTHSQFVGVVHGIGNSRGEVARDPRQPLAAAEALGREFFTLGYSDYRLDTPREHHVWGHGK
ncbi:flavodoxin family protein [Bordetella sp. BOR01]|uniref:flavodoxin family protein n=1 Tax=Bordetella sp. BOR01 TaxID=2854779 RepID=UPI001C4725F0|nr:NAD(P)H-dependent oxidoreductase [Bordetella sp. BOR01]MBV7481844.1 flavodoxin family protein [Bordetella sp. BOR01]